MALHRTRVTFATATGETTVTVTVGDRIRLNRALKADGSLDDITVYDYRARLAHVAAVREGVAPEDFDEWAETLEAIEETDSGEAAATPAS